MADNVLYELECITDNPNFEGFAFVRGESIRNKGRLTFDFLPDNIQSKGRKWTVTPMSAIWVPQPVQGRVRPYNDYPCVNLSIPAFSRRTVDALRDFLAPNGELLPLVSSVGEYYVYNITTVADILDDGKSDIRWANEKKITAIEVSRYECFPDKMYGLSIFRLVEKPSSTFVSQEFVDRVIAHGLQGFHFIKLWPLPSGVNWRDEDRINRQHESLVKTHAGRRSAVSNSVVILLSTAKSTPSKVEKERLANIMDSIDALLYDPTPNSPYLGRLEGDDHHKRECRLFLSCPNADVLVEKLFPLLKALTWAGRVRVLKRYGEYDNPECREEEVEL